jgi:hypothetical protein
MLHVYGEQFVTSCSIRNLEDHPLSVSRYFFFSILTATLYIEVAFPIQPEDAPCQGDK